MLAQEMYMSSNTPSTDTSQGIPRKQINLPKYEPLILYYLNMGSIITTRPVKLVVATRDVILVVGCYLYFALPLWRY